MDTKTVESERKEGKILIQKVKKEFFQFHLPLFAGAEKFGN